ncbi:Serine/threonine-protein kinase RIO3 [Nibea albiflora]|uniref:Serine/threonine-protein kinase RIO3 n=1 Tax=Nibea albiflora TaxID=240163 RepID=A0ACB7F580_NIBAL|nr:Serine/threonine-protein kinase RIO3 [Nibea albiflora]
MYQECNLVHADLSEYNMLWHDGKVWLIDVSQSIEPTHPHGLEFLFRDCRNVSTIMALEKRNEDHVQKRGKKTFPVGSEDAGPPLKPDADD